MQRVKMTEVSVDTHRRRGQRLYEAKRALLDVPPYFAKGARASALTNRALRALDALRDELDEEFCREHPRDFDSRVYYPGN